MANIVWKEAPGLYDSIVAAGHSVVHYSTGTVADDPVAVQAIINAYDPFPLVRAAKWEEIKSERDRRQGLGVRVGGSMFHSDDKSRIQQLGLVMMGSAVPAGLQWKTMDGTFVTMTQGLAAQVFAATAASDQAIFAAAEAHRDAMLISADPAAYDFSAGWPEL
jgi:hypothetical protein